MVGILVRDWWLCLMEDWHICLGTDLGIVYWVYSEYALLDFRLIMFI